MKKRSQLGKLYGTAVCLALAMLLPLCGCAWRLDRAPESDGPVPASTREGELAAEVDRPETDDRSAASDRAKPFAYAFDPHVISKAYIRVYGEEIEPLFYSFCDAVLAGRDSFPCPSAERLHRLLEIARVCLPVAAFCIRADDVSVKDGVGYLSYSMDRDELLRTVKAFQSKVTGVISGSIPCREEDFIMAAELLRTVAHKDIAAEEDLVSFDNALSVMPYRAIMEDKGICQEIAGEYIYYLLQIGIDATTCSALSSDQEYAHMWAIAELDGAYYHIDPMFTIEYPDSLAFFCLNDDMRSQYGDFPIENFTYAESDAFAAGDFAADSERFKPLWRAESYQIDRENRVLRLKLFDLYAQERYDEFSY